MRFPKHAAAIAFLTLLGAVAPALAADSAEQPAWVGPMREVHAKFRGKPGTLAQFGDSITVTLAYWTPLLYEPPKNLDDAARADYELVKQHLHRDCWREWKGAKFGSESGQTMRWALEHVDTWLGELQPEVAVIMFGTNDLANVTAEDYESRAREVVSRCLAKGTVVILSTIPPRHGREEKAAEFADIARKIGRELNVPVCDYHAEIIARRPDDWDGALPKFSDRKGYDVLTLIAGDGVHPSNPKEFSNDFSEEALRTNGFSLRNNVVLRSYAQVLRQVIQADDEDGLSAAEPATAKPVLIDTDLGTWADDPFAIGLLMASPEVRIEGLTTSGGNAADRAWIACRLLSHSGYAVTPVAAGADPQPDYKLDWQIQYRRHPAVIFNRTQKVAKESAEQLLHDRLAALEEPATILALGPLTNIARLLEKFPDDRQKIARIVFAERNLTLDAAAARSVIAAGVPLTVAPISVTEPEPFSTPNLELVFNADTRLTHQLKALHQLWEGEKESFADVVAATAVCNHASVRFTSARIELNEQGRLRTVSGTANAELIDATDDSTFVSWMASRLASYGEESLPEPPSHIVEAVDPGGLPLRVHAFEDFETEIERRWWMTGKLETSDVAPGRGRAGRGTITQDFDDLQGQTKTSYTAVVFNPVPGPPMGPRTRLFFRYKLEGTSVLRVQLYSLSNGYHRYLSLHGLPRGEWRSATVDMTQMRRPDGSGGPLAADERIDDIQFYVDPRAEVLIDDMILYEAAPDEESRPFPNRILFTGWFDTGKQGNEWPGDFAIEPHAAPRTWKFAKSVLRKGGKESWLRVGLRGPRPLDEQTRLRFLYRLSGAERIGVELADSSSGLARVASLEGANGEEWAEVEVDFPTAEDGMTHADELRFLVPAEAELAIDDLLLYVP